MLGAVRGLQWLVVAWKRAEKCAVGELKVFVEKGVCGE